MPITQIPLLAAFIYLAVIVDWLMRKGLLCWLSIAFGAAFRIKLVEYAIICYGKPKIRNMDQSS